MRLVMVKLAFWIGLGLAAWGLFGTVERAAAQPEGGREHIYLPPALGATPLSTIIQAQAQYVAACGDYLESFAIARKINAEAVALEIQNSIDAVDAFFKRRELNRAWRAKENPNYWARMWEQEQKREKLIQSNLAEYMRTHSETEGLNWLLGKLSALPMAVHYSAARESLGEVDRPLPSPEDLKLIRLNDGAGLIFGLGDRPALQTNWPLALRRPEFRKACADFEKARDEAFEEIKANGSTSEEDREKLVQAVVQLASQLERVYPREVRKDTSVFLTYSTARNYLHSLIYQVNRALSTNDKRLLLGGNAFEGKTVLDLFQYMYEMGVVFAPPEPGGERVYKTLMENMRNIYVTLGSE